MSFGDQVKAFTVKAKDIAEKEFAKNTLALYADIVRGTPVDEGTLQNNWQFGVNSVNSDKLPAPGSKAALPVVQRGARVAKTLRLVDVAVIFNNMEYAGVIENGLSGTRRIPARMVARAILAAKARNR